MRRRMVMGRWMLVAVLGGGLLGCSNPSTPAGYVGYVQRGAIVGRAAFYDLQTGPTSSGLGWMLSAVNVPVTPITFDELFKVDDGSAILSKDNLQIAFAVHTVFRVRPDRVRELVEKFTYDAENPVGAAYSQYLREPLRTISRAELQRFDSFGIKDNIDVISGEIQKKVEGLAEGTPFEIIQVVVGNIQYPQQVATAVAAKMAATQLLAQQATQLAIVEKQAEQRVAEAKGIAEAQHIINATLTSQYLQHEAIQAQEKSIGSPNHTTVYLPIGPMGVPLVGALPLGGGQ